ncbi:MAG: adenine nucleotide alpha hydrolase family protein, partial [Acidimicrobiales bacterium]
MTVAVCLKWVDDRPVVDPLSGDVRTDARTSGASAADRAALEWALRMGRPVVAITAGPPQAESMLRDAVATGATHAVRVDMDPAAPSEVVAEGLVTAIA